MTDLDLSKLMDKTPNTPVDLTDTSAGVETTEQKFQHYKSSRVSMRMITPGGKHIAFAHYTFITADPEVFAYLDSEIDYGIMVITKGELLTHSESDPMEILKRKFIAEYKEEEAAKAAKALIAGPRNMGSTKSKEAIASGVAPTSTSEITAAAESSAS